MLLSCVSCPGAPKYAFRLVILFGVSPGAWGLHMVGGSSVGKEKGACGGAVYRTYRGALRGSGRGDGQTLPMVPRERGGPLRLR